MPPEGETEEDDAGETAAGVGSGDARGAGDDDAAFAARVRKAIGLDDDDADPEPDDDHDAVSAPPAGPRATEASFEDAVRREIGRVQREQKLEADVAEIKTKVAEKPPVKLRRLTRFMFGDKL